MGRHGLIRAFRWDLLRIGVVGWMNGVQVVRMKGVSNIPGRWMAFGDILMRV